ncbi:tetratricopeptide repeat-containing serine protease family protein [Glycomyces sp. A-F 0318]|uniref:tetratricopeptide repeat-containing S1 family peptidase n=1 Tax=Glycomyces amatae TaxID=2881355 RepID=UPI001E5C3684|nr:tetratricopeptide repeat-containing serine protease family protein [Glycomyces amatae]
MNSPASFDPRLARVVKIKVADESGVGTIGSGYLIAPGLVLTARHVLWRDSEEVNGDYPVAALRVRAATGPSTGVSLPASQVIVLGEASGVDVAVLIVPGLEPVAGTAMVGARFTTSQPVPGCWMVGYPKAAHQDTTVGPEYVGVSLLPVSGTASGRITVRVDTPPARKEADWGGLSGSGVVDAQNRLLGVLVDVQVKWKDRLAVVPIAKVTEAIAVRIDQHPELAPLLEMPVVEEAGEDPLFDHSKFPARMRDLRGESLFDALQFKYRVVDFIADGDRRKHVENALAWVRATGDRPDVKVAVVTGRAGVGKSRLAAEICDQLKAREPWWQVGFADHTKLVTAPVPAVPTVVVVDYPERHPEAVGSFIKEIHEARRNGVLQAPVRVVLVARDERSWFERARTNCKNLDQLIDHRIALGTREFSDDARDRHAEAAYSAFCDGFDLTNKERPAFAARGKHVLDRPLLVHAAALLAAWRLTQNGPVEGDAAGAGPVITNQGRLLDDLIGAEIDRLRRLRRDDDGKDGGPVFTSAREVREALCVTTLTTPARSDLPALLALTEAFGPGSNANTVTAADTLMDCFGTDTGVEGETQSEPHVSPVEPDLIAAHLLATTPGRTDLIKRLVASDIVAKHPAYRAQMIGALALASKDYPEIGTDLRTHLADALTDLINATGTASLAGLLTDHLDALVTAVVAAATDQDLTPARRLAAALELPAADREHDIDHAAAEVYLALPYPHPGLTGLGVTLTRRALAHTERGHDTAQIATASGTLGNWLSDNGQRPEALAAAQRAVDLREELAADNRAAHLPDLAMSVNNLAVHLAEAGRREEGLAAAQRAVDLREELAAQNPAAYLPDLATSVNNLAVYLSAAGRREEGLAAAQRAVDLREELAAQNPAAYLPDLATSVNNLAIRLAEAGRREEGLAAAQRAVDLREELAADNRAAHLPDLAASVNNLAVRLGEAGQRPEALAAAQRAVDLYEELAAQNPAAYLPDLARSYWTAAYVRRVLGQEADVAAGIEWCEQAIALYQELAASEPDAFTPLLETVQALRIDLAAMTRPDPAN